MSDFTQYENARHLGEAFAETVPGMHLLAVRDHEDDGETLLFEQNSSTNSLDDAGKLVVTKERREFELALTFDELNASPGDEVARKTLFARWKGEAATPAEPQHASFLPHRAKAAK